MTKVEAQEKILHLLGQGSSVREACAAVGRAENTYFDWTKHDEDFKFKLRDLRSAQDMVKGTEQSPVPDFETFCRDWLNQPLHLHQQRMMDVLEGNLPRDMHQSMRYQPGQAWEAKEPGMPAGRVIVNLPPGHAKTTTVSINWVTWLIHRNPNIKIIIVCKDLDLAKQIVGGVKFRLTSSVYREMHAKFAPDGGWKDPDQSWTANAIYVQGKNDGEKDPTLQALGIGGRIYGARSDVILLDDAVTLANVNEYEKQARWLQQEVESRLDGTGLLAILGTRVAPTDLYSHVRDELTNWDDVPIFTYFAMPALLEDADEVEKWVTLWPEQFPGKRLRGMRRQLDLWSMVYQQMDWAEDATFNSKAVEASVNAARFPGRLTDVGMMHRKGGMEGLYVVGGLDPATVGNTAMLVVGLDRSKEKRFVLDGFNQANTTPYQLRETVKRLTTTYSINEWVIERNAFQRFLTQDQELNLFLRQHGCKLTEHYTNSEKFDADFGVQAMAQLFLSCGEPYRENMGGPWRKTPDKALIELPATKQNAWVGELINQLVVWQPSGMKQKQKTDLVMALWFTEIACKKVLGYGQKKLTHMQNDWLSPARRSQRRTIDLVAYREAMMSASETA